MSERREQPLRERVIAALKLPATATDDTIVATVTRAHDINAWEVSITNKINESGGALTRTGAIAVLQATRPTS